MSTAFKEWSLICNALLQGKQTLILRKGGIAEGRKGFAFEHPDFYFYPTNFHNQVESTRFPEGTPIPSKPDGKIEILGRASIAHTAVITDWEKVLKLEPFHFWTRKTIEDRFQYDQASCIHLAVVRVEKASQPWQLDESPAYGGCKSWIEFPEPPAEISWSPVLTNSEFDVILNQIKNLL